MSFQSLAFFGFLAAALAVCLTAGRRSPRAGAAMLAAASAVFCLLGPGGWTVVLGGVACLLAGICVTAWAIRRMARSGGRRRTMVLACVYHIAILVGFKYTEFLTGGAVEVGWAPLGLSFFTFQQIAWLVDSFCMETGDYSFWDYFLFTVYFPKIAMGPILLHGEFMPQLKDPSRLKADSRNMAEGLMILAVGLFKKVILAEFFAGPVNWGYAQVEILSSTDAFLVMLAYTFQLYFDFSGYCDMAMGISRMFNLELPLNFNSPYKALSPVEFWKRWHMTLTRFLRTYIYFPLGGSRKGSLRTYMNIMIVFLVSGFWHGAAWTFILWGALHGAAQALNRVFKRQWENLHTAFRWMATFLFVNLTWVIFRSESISQAKLFLKRLLDFGNMQINPSFMDSFKMVELPLWLTGHRVFTVLGLYGIVLCLVMNARNMGETELRPTFLRGAGTALLLVWSVLSLAGISGFIYFQF